MAEKQQRKPTIAARDFLNQLGPGLIAGASDDDPSGIGTYSQAGAQLGFSIGWTILLTFPLMAAIQEISARIDRTTGHGIAGNLRRHYSDWLLYPIVGLLFNPCAVEGTAASAKRGMQPAKDLVPASPTVPTSTKKK